MGKKLEKKIEDVTLKGMKLRLFVNFEQCLNSLMQGFDGPSGVTVRQPSSNIKNNRQKYSAQSRRSRKYFALW